MHPAKEDLSEASIRANCPHCDPTSQAFKHRLEETDDFWIVCDAHSIEPGHILIIPKTHLSCIGEYDDATLAKFMPLHAKVMKFLHEEYGQPVGVFEHGKLGQTVFHSHVHYMPFVGTPTDIVPEGANKLSPLANLSDLKGIFGREGGYLYFGIDDAMWTVDTSLAAPRFFRDRFARALGVPEYGNWKAMHENPTIMQAVEERNTSVQDKWRAFTQPDR